MEESQNGNVSRTWLECQSTGELIKLADSYGIDIPPGLERIFIIEELLECTNTSDKQITEELEVNPTCSKTAALPKQYNISYIDVMIRDPLWVFVFWEIKGADRELYENTSDFKGYCLRIVPLNEGETEQKSGENSFTVPIDTEDTARYFGFAEQSSHSQNRYIIKLGIIRGDSEIQIAASQPFCLPMLIKNEKINSMKENPLVRLSGIHDLSITQSTDRHSRVKRSF